MFIPTDILTYIVLGAALLTMINIAILIRTITRMKNLVRGKGAISLEDSVVSLDRDAKEMIKFRGELEHYLESVEMRLKRSIQGVHTLRFNPFKGNGGGGNQSFATALLNERGDGVILSSLYSRDHVSVFSKPVKGFASEYELSEEELESLVRAKESTLG